MPIYEYKCTDCCSHFEKRQKISDEPMKICENCGGAVEKQWSRTGFQFKGEGWYVTDYASKKDGGKESAAQEKSASSESTATPDSASKPKSDAAKSESTKE